MRKIVLVILVLTVAAVCRGQSWAVGDTAVTGGAVERLFEIRRIDAELARRMQGRSIGRGCTVTTNQLRLLILPYYDATDSVRVGQMVCNRRVAQELLDIFRELYRNKYRIESIRLVDDFDGDDRRSMEANNTSCFNFRRVAGAKSLSRHAYGMAVDLNPLYNPYVRRGKVAPPGAEKYADRSKPFPYKIDPNDLAYKLFTQKGWRWGGSWRTMKDYQHFEKR